MARKPKTVTPTATGESVATEQKTETPIAAPVVVQAPAAPTEPRSVCVCGHTGDGPKSQHNDLEEPGLGLCVVPGCDCFQFKWKEFLPKYANRGVSTSASKAVVEETKKKILAAAVQKAPVTAPGKVTTTNDPGPAAAMAAIAPAPIVKKNLSDEAIESLRKQGMAVKVVAEGPKGKTVELTKNGHTNGNHIAVTPKPAVPALSPEMQAKVDEARKLLESLGQLKPKRERVPRTPAAKTFQLIQTPTGYAMHVTLNGGSIAKDVEMVKTNGTVKITVPALGVLTIEDTMRMSRGLRFAGRWARVWIKTGSLTPGNGAFGRKRKEGGA